MAPIHQLRGQEMTSLTTLSGHVTEAPLESTECKYKYQGGRGQGRERERESEREQESERDRARDLERASERTRE